MSAERSGMVTSKGAVLDPNAKGWQEVPAQPETPSPSTHEPLGTWGEGPPCFTRPHSEGPKGQPQGATPDPVSETSSKGTGTLNGMDPTLTEAGGDPQVTGGADQRRKEAAPSNEDLRTSLKKQLESCFSRENLSKDLYLVSQMDSDHFVPIWTIANIEGIKKLTTDLQLILDVLRSSPMVQVDESGERARPNHKRCIIILREVPESTPVEDVEALFKSDSCPAAISCEFAHNSSWYITFQTDSDAQQAFRYLREEVKTFQGKPILARIKAKPIAINAFFPKNGYRALEGGVYAQQAQQPYPSQLFVQPVYSPQQQYTLYSGIPQPWTASRPYFQTPLAPFPNSGFVNGFSSAGGYKLASSTQGHARPYYRNRTQGKPHTRTGHLEGAGGFSTADGGGGGISVQAGANEQDETAGYGQRGSPPPSGTARSLDPGLGVRGRRGTYRGRKRREEDRTVRPLPTDSTTQKIDLELSNFPPLPGAACTSRGEPLLQNRMADVVRGLCKHKDRGKDSLVNPPDPATAPEHNDPSPEPQVSCTCDPVEPPETAETADSPQPEEPPPAEVVLAPSESLTSPSPSVSSRAPWPAAPPLPEPRKPSYAEVCQRPALTPAPREGRGGGRAEEDAPPPAVGVGPGECPLDGRTSGRSAGRKGSPQ